MENTLIRFEVYQYISFILSCSLFFYMAANFVRWFITESIPKKLTAERKSGFFN